MKYVLLFLVIFANQSLLADSKEEKPNCKLQTQTWYESGKKKLDIDNIYASTREACKSVALQKELSAHEDGDIRSVKVRFGYSGTYVYKNFDERANKPEAEVMRGSLDW